MSLWILANYQGLLLGQTSAVGAASIKVTVQLIHQTLATTLNKKFLPIISIRASVIVTFQVLFRLLH